MDKDELEEVEDSELNDNQEEEQSSSGISESTTDVVFSGHAMISENGSILEESKRFTFENELLISDIDVLVVGEKNVIFLAQYDSLLERLLSQISVIEKFLLDVFNIPYKVIFLLKDEWEYEKKKYISNLKSSYKYSYIDEEVGVKDFNLDNKDDDIEKIISIFGDDVIKYK